MAYNPRKGDLFKVQTSKSTETFELKQYELPEKIKSFKCVSKEEYDNTLVINVNTMS